MKKFYHKKDLPVEESPLTLQLQRRHTVVEGDKDKAPVVTKLRPVSRSNSTSSIYRPPKSAKDLSSQKRYLESTLSADSSGVSPASTVVITECQLSSSWLYNNKKAQMCSKETLSPGKSCSKQASDNEEAKSPIISRSKVKSVSSPERRSKRCSSCCCYAAIVILAGLAVMGIISAIGGIIYMEFFSGTNKTQTHVPEEPTIGRSEDLSYTKKVGHSLDVADTSQDLISRKDISVSSPESKQELEVLNHFKDSRSSDVKNKHGSGNILRVKKVKKDIVPTKEADTSTSSIRVTNESQLLDDSRKKQSFHQVDVPSPETKNDSPYSKLFELYKDIHNNLLKIPSLFEEPSSTEVDVINQKTPDFKESISDLNESGTSLAEADLAEHHEIKNYKNLSISGVSFDSNDFSNESLKQNLNLNLEESHASKEVSSPPIPKYFFRRPTKDPGLAFREIFDISEESDSDNSEMQSVKVLPQTPQLSEPNDDSDDNVASEHGINNQFASSDSKKLVNADLDSELHTRSVPSVEVSRPAIPKNFFQMPSKDGDPAFRNMFDINEESDVDHSEEQSFPRFLPHIPELSDQNDASDNDNIASNLDINNKELPIELNRPVSGTKIAVPGPLDLLRRFTTGTDNKGNSDMDQHDRRFFLAQALERLRTLDVRNILPSSRQKSDSKKIPKQKLEPKVQSEQEVVTERSGYLQKLRRHFFEK